MLALKLIMGVNSMSENETWLSRFLKENPTDEVKLHPYYIEKKQQLEIGLMSY